jgi:serine/threonine-protein kinase
VPAFHLALAYVGVGDDGAAFDALERALADRDPLVGHVAVDPVFDPIRNDPRFEHILATLRLPSMSPSTRGASRRG